MTVLPSIPNYTDLHNRVVQYHEEQVDIVFHAFRSWCFSLDCLTFSFFNSQIDQVLSIVDRQARSAKIFIHQNQIKKA